MLGGPVGLRLQRLGMDLLQILDLAGTGFFGLFGIERGFLELRRQHGDLLLQNGIAATGAAGQTSIERIDQGLVRGFAGVEPLAGAFAGTRHPGRQRDDIHLGIAGRALRFGGRERVIHIVIEVRHAGGVDRQIELSQCRRTLAVHTHDPDLQGVSVGLAFGGKVIELFGLGQRQRPAAVAVVLAFRETRAEWQTLDPDRNIPALPVGRYHLGQIERDTARRGYVLAQRTHRIVHNCTPAGHRPGRPRTGARLS